MNQQDIVNIINSSLVDYNIRWDDIKHMADHAILKINAFLGADYPPMSEVLQSPAHTYTVRINNRDLPIFPEKYIYTVVIPFIQSEVLAKDEEFTTIYNKYVMDYNDGLFDMSSNEYNRIPLPFKQDDDSGVFFTNEGYAPKFGEYGFGKQRKRKPKPKDKPLPEFACNIRYHINNPKLRMTTKFTNDIVKYPYRAEVDILDCVPNPQLIGIEGYEKCFFDINTDCILYRFKGWSYNERTEELAFVAGETWSPIVIKGDVDLYAVWEEESIFDNNAGTISIKSGLAPYVRNLVIPENVNGYPVLAIGANFDISMDNLVSVTIPKTVSTINAYAFTKPSIANIIFPEYNYLFNAPRISLSANAIFITGTSNLHALYLPYSIASIATAGIFVGTNYLEIYCEVSESDKPNGWVGGWYSGVNVKVVWGVANG